MKRYREAAARFVSSRFLPFVALIQKCLIRMNLFELTRALVDIESTTNHEKNVGDYLFAHLSALTARHNGHLERIPAEPNRDNIFASWGEPVVTLSPRKARCATKSRPAENWRLSLITIRPLPRSTRCLTCYTTFARFRCRTTRCSATAR